MKKTNIIFGTMLIALSLFAYFPSTTPGVMPIIGFSLSFVAVFLSLFITSKTMFFFWTTVIIFLSEMIFFNDLLRLINAQDKAPLTYIAEVYVLTFIVLFFLYIISKWLKNGDTDGVRFDK